MTITEGLVIILAGTDPTNITDLSGLGSLISIDGDLDIRSNDALTNLTGLEQLSYIGRVFAIIWA